MATELNVGDIADGANSEGLVVMLPYRCWNTNGKLVLEPVLGPENSELLLRWPFKAASLALCVIIEPFRLEMWLSSLKFVLLLDIGELQVVVGCDFDEVVDGPTLCWTTANGIRLCSESVDLKDSLRNCFTWLFCFWMTWYRVGLASFVRTWRKIFIYFRSYNLLERLYLKNLRWNINTDALQWNFNFFILIILLMLLLQSFSFSFLAFGFLQKLFTLKLLLQLSSWGCCYWLECWAVKEKTNQVTQSLNATRVRRFVRCKKLRWNENHWMIADLQSFVVCAQILV